MFKAFEESARGTESENNVKGLFDDFVLDSNKAGCEPAARHENLLKLMDAVADMNLGKDTRIARMMHSVTPTST